MADFSCSGKLNALSRFAQKARLRRNWDLYLLLLLPFLYFLIFHMFPIYGVQIAFKKYSAAKGIFGSRWVGFDHFENFFSSYYFSVVMKNTLLLSFGQLILGFPAPLLLALSINEVEHQGFKRTIQTVTYLPHFLSVAVVVAMLKSFLSPSVGAINQIIEMLGGESYYFMSDPAWFKPLYIISGIWQNMGWGSIVYLAALSSISVDIYEAARIDGASRMQRIIYINLPHLLPTICTLFILNTGKVMSLGFEKVFLMQNPLNIDTSEIISTYIYKKGILNAQYSFSTAVGLFNSVINLFLVLVVNGISRKINETSIW